MADFISRNTDISKASAASQKILDDVSEKSSTRLYQLQGVISEDTINSVWSAFGVYVQKQIRSGRSVKVPHFGVFTFTNPDVTLPGVTNPEQRDKQFREPVFIVQKEFLSGLPLQSGVFTDQGVRAINLSGMCGNIQMIQANFSEIAESANCSKENVRIALDRVFRQISNQGKKDGSASMIIPAVGTLYLRRGVVSVNFLESLRRDCKGIVKRPLEEQIQMRQRYLTADKLKQFDQMSQSPSIQKDINNCFLEDGAVEWLSKNYDFKVDPSLTSRNQRPQDKQKQGVRASSVSLTNETAILLHGQQPLKKMNEWLLSSGISPLQLFNDISSKKAKYPSFIPFEEQGENIRLNKEDFISFLVKFGCPLPISELEYVFMKVDKQSNGYVDYTQFREELSMKEETQKRIQKELKDTWIKMKLGSQRKNLKDLLTEPDKKCNLEEIQQLVANIEPQFATDQVQAIAKTLLGGFQTMEASKLANILQNTFDELQADSNWVTSMKRKILQQISSNKDAITFLITEFQNNDRKKSGYVDLNGFKAALRNANIEINAPDLNRLFKHSSLPGGTSLDYISFAKSVENSVLFASSFTNKDSNNLQKLARSIYNYIEQNGKNCSSFLKHILTKDNQNAEEISKIKVSAFARLIFKFVNPDIKPHLIETLAEIIDIDKDGFIDKFDLETFTGRYKNFSLSISQKTDDAQPDHHDSNKLNSVEKSFLPPSLQKLKQSTHEENLKEESEEPIFCASPFPSKQLEIFEIDELNSQIRRALNDKKISNYDAFNLLDSNQDGFITLNEISNLDKILHLSQKLKEGYFGFMDNQNTGMIDYQRFLDVMNRPANYKKEAREDNWDWQVEVLEKIKKWYKSQNLKLEDAFKIVDVDFDENIGRKDLYIFLSDILHIPSELITDTRLDRLYKLIDQHKRDLIQIGDFQKLVEDQVTVKLPKAEFHNRTSSSLTRLSKPHQRQTSLSQFNTGGLDQEVLSTTPSLKHSSTSIFRLSQTRKSEGFPKLGSSLFNDIFEWKKNAKHSIGLFVSKNYQDIRHSFEAVSQHSNRLLYSKFRNWIDENRVLKGFNLTEKLLQQLFSDFDPHKKGYLSEHDWLSQLKKYDSTQLIIKEINELIASTFHNINEAFSAFSAGEKDINFKKFQSQVNAQLPKRFREEELIKTWNRVAGSIGHTMNLHDFKECFNNNESSVQDAPFLSGSVMKSPFNSTLSLIQYDDSQFTSMNVIEKMKKLVRSSDKDLESLFAEFDKFNTGLVTNLEFRNVMRRLNIGLSTYDIDSVLNICQTIQGGTINWREFCHKIRQTESDIRLVTRAKQRLEKIKKDIYLFLLTPKDAFRQYNENRTGKMSFEEFQNLIIQLCQLSQSELPSLSILKDIFEFIDIRKDGVIDIHEWMETFKKLDGESELSSGRLMQLSTKKDSSSLSKSAVVPKVVDLSKSNTNGESRQDRQVFGWESTQQFDQVLTVIGKNRKILLEIFKNEHKQMPNITYEKAKSIINSVLVQSNIHLSEKNFSSLIKFSEKSGVIDYRFMMEVFKQRQQQALQYPTK